MQMPNRRVDHNIRAPLMGGVALSFLPSKEAQSLLGGATIYYTLRSTPEQ